MMLQRRFYDGASRRLRVRTDRRIRLSATAALPIINKPGATRYPRRRDSMAYQTITARPISGALGAIIEDVDLSRDLDNATASDLHQALLIIASFSSAIST
jgi:hypothetical protein